MGKLSEILALAQSRARGLSLPYEGALTPREAYEVMRTAPGAQLIDVRSRAELDLVGRVPGAVEIEWQDYPANRFNANFLAQLRQAVDPEALLLFISRSGRRSSFAARLATEAGFRGCYNVLEGFEGDKDARSQRGSLGGWRLAGLPWQQS